LRIGRIRLNEVRVRAHPDSINSPETDHPLHKLPLGASKAWTLQFDEVPKTIIRLELESGTVGIGECYRGVSTELIRQIAQRLIGQDLSDLTLQNLPVPPGRAYDGFECAILDAFGRSRALPLYQLLGGKYRDEVHVAYWTGHRTTSDAVRKAKDALKQGFDCIKFKCRLDDPMFDWCEGIAQACAEKVSIVLDPNERFETPAQAEALGHRLESLRNILYFEDPIPRWDMESWRHLRSKISIPLAMHISLPYAEMGQMPQDAARAVRIGACDYFNLNGGIYAFKMLAGLADLFDMPYSHGSELDLGILEASYVHKCAAGRLATLPSDILGRLVREHDLLQQPLSIANGMARVPSGSGLGVELDEAALKHYTISSWEIH
jgi:muconate cycloisomerase